MQHYAPNMSNSNLKKFVTFFIILIISSYTFLSYWEYSKEFHQAPTEWSTFLQGHASAPAQYRIGVMFPASFISKLSHSHLAMRHTITLVDFVFLAIGLSIIFPLISRTHFYQESSYSARCVVYLLAILLLLFYLSWTFWYHKPETIANLGSLAIAAALIAGLFRIPRLLAALGLIAISAYLGTIRADSGLALNLGLVVVALLPEKRSLPLGRITQIFTGVIGIATVLGVESYIKYVLYPQNPLSDSLFQLVTNLTSPVNLFCVIFALAPYFLIVALACKYWRRLEAWERTLMIASLIEFTIYFIVAKADEVRLFIPYAIVLLPTSAMLLYFKLFGEQTGQLPEMATETKL